MHQGKIVYQGTTKDSEPLLIRYIQQGDEEKMVQYINTISKEKSVISI